MIDIRWYGRGGQGAFTAARLLGRIMSLYEGRYALAYPSFGPERRGAPVWSFTRIDETKIIDRGQPKSCDYLIVLDETLLGEETADVLKEDGVAIINTPKSDGFDFIRQRIVRLDATKMATSVLGKPITNVAMIGAFAATSGILAPESADDALRDFFSPKLYEGNKILLQKAFDAVEKEG
jgi:pyruvate ferredoxin oxidoreductase gamma subunit